MLASLYMSIVRTQTPGMNSRILSQNTDLPAPDGPARPTKIGRPWELDLRSWMARMVRKKPLSNVRSSSNRAIC